MVVDKVKSIKYKAPALSYIKFSFDKELPDISFYNPPFPPSSSYLSVETIINTIQTLFDSMWFLGSPGIEG